MSRRVLDLVLGSPGITETKLQTTLDLILTHVDLKVPPWPTHLCPAQRAPVLLVVLPPPHTHTHTVRECATFLQDSVLILHGAHERAGTLTCPFPPPPPPPRYPACHPVEKESVI